MKKLLCPAFSIFAVSVSAFFLATSAVFATPKKSAEWELAWADEFNSPQINSRYWSKIERGKPDWKKHMSPDPSLYAVKKGNLILRGKVNTNKKDPVPFITGGITTMGKFSFLEGKIEVRAKLDSAKGAWPAIWLLPEKKAMKWPDDGEIDIMEHLNFDDFAYQTVHTKYTQKNGANPPKGGTGKIKKDDYNVYGLEWHPDELVFTINGKKTFSYPRLPEKKNEGQWPFTNPFYILIDMQLGGAWVGNVNPEQLPVEMHVDWVRVYRRK